MRPGPSARPGVGQSSHAAKAQASFASVSAAGALAGMLMAAASAAAATAAAREMTSRRGSRRSVRDGNVTSAPSCAAARADRGRRSVGRVAGATGSRSPAQYPQQAGHRSARWPGSPAVLTGQAAAHDHRQWAGTPSLGDHHGGRGHQGEHGEERGEGPGGQQGRDQTQGHGHQTRAGLVHVPSSGPAVMEAAEREG